MTSTMTITGRQLKKVFNWRTIFEGITFSVSTGEVLLIAGRNGSGKSTLVKVISGVLTPSAGTVTMATGAPLKDTERLAAIGLVSPYLQLYDEFTGRENLELAQRIRGAAPDAAAIAEQLSRVSLLPRADDLVRTYSSGMKQRMKYAFALAHRPHVLILDEPMSNLDSEGIAIVREIMDHHRRSGILIVATNDLTDVDVVDRKVDLNAAG